MATFHLSCLMCNAQDRFSFARSLSSKIPILPERMPQYLEKKCTHTHLSGV